MTLSESEIFAMKMVHINLALSWVCGLVGGAILADSAVAQTSTYPVMIQLDLADETIQATPVVASQQEVIMLGRDGQLWDFAPNEATNFTRLAQPFAPFPQSELRGKLLSEFGRGFEVSGTGNYLVVHPAGAKERWANQFEQLFRSFQQYFTARGIRPERNEFPLVAIVFPDFATYQKYAASEGMRVSKGVVGYYSPQTNRVALYDITGGNPNHPLWGENLATVIHEATHQTAFNTGLHSRYSRQPKWFVEGLATMFEAPGVWDSRNNPQFHDRLNKNRLSEFLEYAKTQRKPRSLEQFIATDDAYRSRPSTAYGEGWALVFYLIETRPREFAEYIRTVNHRPAGEDYTPQQRVADFRNAFGDDLNLLESHFLRFMQDAPRKR